METFIRNSLIAASIATASLLLQGCAGMILGSAATGAVVATDQRTTGSVIEDQSIEVKAARELNTDKEIAEQAHVSVTSYDQVVLITGQAPTEALRKRIEDKVSKVEKVRQIHNELTLAAPISMMSRTNDTVLTTKVKTKLLANENLSGNKVKVVSEDSVVYLLGLVSVEEGNLAAEIASTTSGVSKVVKLFESR